MNQKNQMRSFQSLAGPLVQTLKRPPILPPPPPPPSPDFRANISKKETILQVLPVKENNIPLKCKVTLGLPEPPFLLTVVAPRKSGKTNLVVDLLLDADKYKNKFDVIFIWSRTFHLDGKWKNICLPPGSIFDKFNENDVTVLLETAEEVNKVTPVNTLFIFDDMVTEGIMNSRRMGALEAIAVRGRHVNVSIIIITQQYLALSPPVRNNTTNMVIFRVRNGDEMEKITRENREWMKEQDFKAMFYDITKDPYSFLHINNQRQDPKERFHKNWLTDAEKEPFSEEEMSSEEESCSEKESDTF